jgi:glycosyltransferase involved in cell wall biosynthesis
VRHVAGANDSGMNETRPDAPRAVTLGVGVCALNEGAALPRLLTRLLDRAAHEDVADRVVVADGGSSDSTRDVARACGATVLEVARGRGVQLGAAARELLTGRAPDVLLFLHADSLPAPTALAALRRAFAGGIEAAGLRQRIPAQGAAMRLVERAADARVRRGMVYGDSGLALTPVAYARSGGFLPLPLFEDVALSKALRRAGVRVALLEDAVLETSARRWEREGFLRCTLRNWMLRSLYEVGVPPGRLARRYRPHTNP